MPPARDSRGRFVGAGGGSGDMGDALESAARGLSEFAQQVEESTRATEDATRAKKEEGKSFQDRADAVGRFIEGSVSRAAGFATPAANTFSQTGDLDDAFSSFNLSGLSAINNLPGVGGLLAAGTGLGRAQRVLERSGARVTSVTDDLARANIDISDEFINEQIAIAQEQENRVEKARGRVQGRLGTLENIGRATGGGIGADAVNLLREIRDAVKGFLPGSNR